MDMGHSVVPDTGEEEVVVIPRHQQPNDPGCLKCLGVDPLKKKYIMFGSRARSRAGFESIASPVIDIRGTGVCTTDYARMQFRDVRRPIYPLDPDAFD